MYHRILRQEVKRAELPCIRCRRGVLRSAPENVWWRGVRLGRFVVETCTVCFSQSVGPRSGGAIDRAFDRARARGLLPAPEHPGRRPKARVSGHGPPSRARSGPRTPRSRVGGAERLCPMCNLGFFVDGPDDVWVDGVHLGRFTIGTCDVCAQQHVDAKVGRAISHAMDRAAARGLLAPARVHRAKAAAAAARRASRPRSVIGDPPRAPKSIRRGARSGRRFAKPRVPRAARPVS